MERKNKAKKDNKHISIQNKKNNIDPCLVKMALLFRSLTINPTQKENRYNLDERLVPISTLIDEGIGKHLTLMEICEKLDESTKFSTEDICSTAIHMDQLHILQNYVETGTDIHEKRENMLQMAVYFNKLAIIDYLLKRGADVNIDNGLALARAVQKNNLEMVKLLVDNKADINADNGYALSTAAKRGYYDIVVFFVGKGADIHVNKDWPIRIAKSNRSIKVFNFLKTYYTTDWLLSIGHKDLDSYIESFCKMY